MPPDVKPFLPWMLQFAFWASLILTGLKISEVIVRVVRKPRLDVRLTPEAFFRLTDYGETLFCNSVSLAWNGPVVIVDTRAVLRKVDPPTKSFPFKVLEFGEKVKGAGPFPDHYFHSRSAISHLAESKPQRTLYFCVQESYQDKSRKALADFRKQTLEYKQDVLSKAANLPAGGRDTLRQEILRKVSEIVDANLPLMMELVQLEPGQYALTIEVDYQNPKSRMFRGKKTTQSKIMFSIGPEVRDQFRVNLRQTLLVTASNLILDQQDQIIYPEYQPLQLRSV